VAVSSGALMAWGHTSCIPTVSPTEMPAADGSTPKGQKRPTVLTRSKEAPKDGAGQVRPPRPEDSHSAALDFTHSISPIPLEAPFRTPFRMAFDVQSGFSPTLSVTIAGYRELVVRQGLAGTYEGALST